MFDLNKKEKKNVNFKIKKGAEGVLLWLNHISRYFFLFFFTVKSSPCDASTEIQSCYNYNSNVT